MSRSVVSVTFGLTAVLFAASIASAQSSPARSAAVSPQNGSGGSQVFTFTLTSSAGYQDVFNSGPHILFTDGVSDSSGNHYCWFAFGQSGIALAPDNLQNAWGGVAYGSNASVQNSQCAIQGNGSSVSYSGDTVSLNVSIIFFAAYAGSKTIESDCTPTGYAPIGTYNVTPTAPDFTISVSPSSQSVNAGQSTTYTVTATPVNGFNQDITLSLSGPSDGVSGTLSPAVITGGGGTSTLTVTTSASTPTSNWNLTVTGTSPSVTHTAAPVQLAVTGAPPPPPPTRSASVSPQNGSGGGQVFTFTLTSSAGYQDVFNSSPHILFTDGVSDSTGNHYCWFAFGQSGLALAPDNLQNSWGGVSYGASAVVQNSQCAINGTGSSVSFSGDTVTLNVSITFFAAYAGSKTIESDATSNGSYFSIGTYDVTPTSPDFTISVSPSSQSVNAGQSTTYTVTTTPVNGFNQDITLSLSGPSSGVSGTFSPAVITGGSGTSTLTVTTSPSTPTSNWNLTVTGTSPSVTHAAAPVQLAVTGAPPPPPPTRSASVSPQNGSGGEQLFTFTVSSSTGYQDVFNSTPHLLFTDGVSNSSGTHYCWFIFSQSGITLAPDNLQNAWSSVAYGSSATVQNSQCVIQGSGAWVSASGNTVTLNVTITFLTAYTGLKTIESDATSNGDYASIGTYNVTNTSPDFTLGTTPTNQTVAAGQSVTYTVTATPINGFNQNITLATSAVPQGTSASFNPSVIVGGSGSSTLTMTASPTAPSTNDGQIWLSGTSSSLSHTNIVDLTVNGAPPPPPPTLSTDSVSPQNGSGSSQVFTFMLSDSNGYQDLENGRYHVLINSSASGSSGCWVLVQSTGVSLAPDNPMQAWTFVGYGSSATAQNSQCGVSGVGTNVSGSGNSLTLSLALTFTAAFDGTKNVYTDVNSSAPDYFAVTSYTVQ